jgi:nitrate reductase NapE component
MEGMEGRFRKTVLPRVENRASDMAKTESVARYSIRALFLECLVFCIWGIVCLVVVMSYASCPSGS